MIIFSHININNVLIARKPSYALNDFHDIFNDNIACKGRGQNLAENRTELVKNLKGKNLVPGNSLHNSA